MARRDTTGQGRDPRATQLQKNKNNSRKSRRGKERRRGLRPNNNNAEGAGRNDRRELPVLYSRQAGRQGRQQGQSLDLCLLSLDLCKRKELFVPRSFFSSFLLLFVVLSFFVLSFLLSLLSVTWLSTRTRPSRYIQR